MKSLRKDIKGMTLIEVVISLLIVSTASLIMVEGFVTVNRLFYQANQYNETTSEVRAALIPDEKGIADSTENVKVKREQATATVTFYKGTADEVFLQGSIYRATSNQFSDNQLRTFSSNTTLKATAPDAPSASIGSGLYTSYCEMMEEIKDFLVEKGYWNASMKIADGNSSLKRYIREYLLQYATEEQLNKIGIGNSNINIANELGRVYIARYYPDKGEFPSITENTAKKLAVYNKKIYDSNNGDYPGTNNGNYCYPTLVPTFTSTMTLDQLYNQNFYKDHIFIVLHNYANVQEPNTIHAVYDNNSDDNDHWYIFDLNHNPSKEIKIKDFVNDYDTFNIFIDKYRKTDWLKIEAIE